MEDVQELRQEILVQANALYEAEAYARAEEIAREMLAVLPEDAEIWERFIHAAGRM